MRQIESRHTCDLPIYLPYPHGTCSTLLGSPPLNCSNAIDDALCLRFVLLKQLAQLLHYGPEMVHVRLLAARLQAIGHWNAVLLCPVDLRASDRALRG